MITPTFDFGALAYTPCDFSSFRHVAKSTKKTLKYPQNWSQNPPQNHKTTTNKSIKKMHLILERFLPPTWNKHQPKMGGKKLGKFHFGRLGRPRGARRTPKATHWTPRAPKMELKRSPELPKRCPSEPRAPKMGRKLPPIIQKFPNYSKEALTNERTHTHKHTHTQTHKHTQIDAKD